MILLHNLESEDVGRQNWQHTTSHQNTPDQRLKDKIVSFITIYKLHY